jgi:Uma2 family endonuclease
VIFLHRDHFHARHNRVWDGADLVMEVMSDSPADRQRDYEHKLIDYAEAGVAEYWIIDRERQLVIVQGLAGGRYTVLGDYVRGQVAASALPEGFEIEVDALFAAAESVPD